MIMTQRMVFPSQLVTGELVYHQTRYTKDAAFYETPLDSGFKQGLEVTQLIYPNGTSLFRLVQLTGNVCQKETWVMVSKHYFRGLSHLIAYLNGDMIVEGKQKHCVQALSDHELEQFIVAFTNF